MKLYIIGSLRNESLGEVAQELREDGHNVFDDWFAASPTADDAWRDYHQARGDSYHKALISPAAQHVFAFDKKWLEWAEGVVLVMPAGKSGHLELGWALGRGKLGYILFNGEPDRWDVMYQFADGVYFDINQLRKDLNGKTENLFGRGDPRWGEEGYGVAAEPRDSGRGIRHTPKSNGRKEILKGEPDVVDPRRAVSFGRTS